jgi:hypothetical protein
MGDDFHVLLVRLLNDPDTKLKKLDLPGRIARD